jgi:hypothetical protein
VKCTFHLVTGDIIGRHFCRIGTRVVRMERQLALLCSPTQSSPI